MNNYGTQSLNRQPGNDTKRSLTFTPASYPIIWYPIVLY